MAAYASVVSLINLLDQVQQHQARRRQILFHDEQIQALRQRGEFLQDFLERYSHGTTASNEEAEILEGQIVSAAVGVQDVIRSHMVDQVRAACTAQQGKTCTSQRNDTCAITGDSGPNCGTCISKIWSTLGRCLTVLCRNRTSVDLCDLAEMVAEMDSIKALVVKFQDKTAAKAHSSYIANSSTSRVPPSGKTAAIVGLDEEVIQIMDKLTGHPPRRVVFPIVGMGGIGKTTLAKAVYENRLIVEYFDIRIWVTVSQEFSTKQILLQALLAVNPQYKTDGSESEDKMGEKLYKTLCGRRYLIIMDDIWSVEAWEQVKRFFPEYNNGSRILVTTRQSDMGEYFGSGTFKMQFLGDEKSWELFCRKAFGAQSCPPEFEEIGKKIVRKCRGLPLSLAVIGGLLAKYHAKEYWESVEKDMNSILSSENDEQCLNILSLSYRCLPVYLKPCFLHMGIFKEDFVVRVFRLIKLWVAEGFIKPKKDKTMEEVAMDCVRDLIDRNLILDNRDGTISIHDLLREVSLRIGQKEKFFCVINMHIMPNEAYRFFRDKSSDHFWKRKSSPVESTTRAISMLCSNYYYNPIKVNGDLWMVRDQNIDYTTELFPYKLLSFPYLHFSGFSRQQQQRVFPLLYKFWNLQSIIIAETFLKEEAIFDIWIWKMPQIRHILVDEFCIPDPPVSCADDGAVVLENLQTLGVVQNFRCTEQVLERIPNIKHLRLKYSGWSSSTGIEDCCLKNVGRFQKLETLICHSPHRGLRLDCIAFPTSLKHLSTRDFLLDWTDLKMIGELPYLEFLDLEDCEFEESELRIVEGGFRSLKYFQIGCHRLTHWTVDSSQDFPKLERLSLNSARELCEIPDAIADIPTLNLIHLIDCHASLALSALNILKEQLDQGNEDLQVKVFSSSARDYANFLKMVGREELESYQKNFEILRIWDPYKIKWRWAFYDDITNPWEAVAYLLRYLTYQIKVSGSATGGRCHTKEEQVLMREHKQAFCRQQEQEHGWGLLRREFVLNRMFSSFSSICSIIVL